MSRLDSTWWNGPDAAHYPDWSPEARPWCPSCCVRAHECGCPQGNKITDDYAAAFEAHLIRGTE